MAFFVISHESIYGYMCKCQPYKLVKVLVVIAVLPMAILIPFVFPKNESFSPMLPSHTIGSSLNVTCWILLPLMGP